jgi:hypothetical protein
MKIRLSDFLRQNTMEIAELHHHLGGLLHEPKNNNRSYNGIKQRQPHFLLA